MAEVELPNMSISRRVVRGEITLHVKGDGPKWWWEEVFAGIYLSFRMIWQVGFSIMALYLAWVYAEVVLVIVVRSDSYPLLRNVLIQNSCLETYCPPVIGSARHMSALVSCPFLLVRLSPSLYRKQIFSAAPGSRGYAQTA